MRDPLYAAAATLLLLVTALFLTSFGAGRVVASTVIPYAALLILLAGVSWRVAIWAASPVPFRIPVSCGQQKSLPWIKSARIENPSTLAGVMSRMFLDIVFFRSLFRNSRAELQEKGHLFGESKLLWLAGMAFHISLLIVLLRHLRFFLEKTPACVVLLSSLDGFFAVGTPYLYLTDLLIILALLFLLARRFKNPLLRYISQFSDYFALFLLLSVTISGILMRYWIRVDVTGVKRFALGLATLNPVTPDGMDSLFIVHLLLVSVLAIYLPFSKLMHFGAAFLSPTRNLTNNSRMVRHVNPWNYPVKTHPYPEWEEEFKDKLKMAGIPLDEALHGRSENPD